MKSKKWHFIIMLGLVLTTAIVSVILADPYKPIEIAHFIILAATLLFVVLYVTETQRIADATEQKWEEELKPKIMYEMFIDESEPNSKWTKFILMNPTDYLMEISVNCNFKIYGEQVEYTGAYNGAEKWIVFPHQRSQGIFSIDGILNEKGKKREQMITEYNDSNSSKQLTIDLEIEFKNETGRCRKYPPRRHYFDFQRWIWIPDLTQATGISGALSY